MKSPPLRYLAEGGFYNKTVCIAIAPYNKTSQGATYMIRGKMMNCLMGKFFCQLTSTLYIDRLKK